jgi:hypothetical protein
VGNLLGSVTDTVRVDDSLADEDVMATARESRGVGDPDFVNAPVGGSGTVGGESGLYLDDGRSSAMWGYLQDDDLAAHP